MLDSLFLYLQEYTYNGTQITEICHHIVFNMVSYSSYTLPYKQGQKDSYYLIRKNRTEVNNNSPCPWAPSGFFCETRTYYLSNAIWLSGGKK